MNALIRRCVQEPKFEGHDRLLFLMQFSGLAGSYLRLDIEAQYVTSMACVPIRLLPSTKG